MNCSRDIDKFSKDNSNARLNYPIGLLTYNELRLFENARITGKEYYTMTPALHKNSQSHIVSLDADGTAKESLSAYGVRPAIALHYAVDYVSGNGSKNNPYVVE